MTGKNSTLGAVHLTASSQAVQFEALVKGDMPLMVDFYADWCGPCKMAAPVLEKLAIKHAAKLTVVKVDVDALHDISSSYGVMSIPTVITMVRGKEISREIGFVGEAKYEQMIEKAIKAAN